jgi:ArsR family transcriptional regulator
VKTVVNIFKALSDETRLRMLSLIWNGEMCVCEIEKSLNLTQSNASRHLTTLKNAGILSSSKQAQWAYYKLNKNFYENNRELCEYLSFKFKTLPSFQADALLMNKCKKEDLCNCKNDN